LDEPTIGLDPKQIIEVRHLIKSLAGSHTIILSTHILPEVSMTCDRVVIINKGRVAAVDTPQNLTAQLKGAERVRLEGRAGVAPGGVAHDAEILALLQQVPGVRSVAMPPMDARRHFVATVECQPEYDDIRAALAAKVVGAGHELLELRSLRLSLEDIFLQLTTDETAAPGEGKKR
ncbi:MAG: ABC transporter ATP-binding protein, partial [Acidobacteria bacterium]|nr:ABC transporter ATP-binding protein [Acidobacteriota bacterium]